MANHPDYRYITISLDRLERLPVDDDISSSFPSTIDESIIAEEDPVPDTSTALNPPGLADFPPSNSQSMVPNLNVEGTEVDRLLAEISGRALLPPGVPAPSIRSTPFDEAAGRERIFAMAFPTLYPTGRADFNAARQRKVNLNDYARHLMCYHDGRFGRHPRWRFLIFNLLMRRRASNSARFYVSKASGLKDLTREALTEALLTDESLLPRIVRQGSTLTGTRPCWRNKGTGLQAQARFLLPGMSPVFLTFPVVTQEVSHLLLQIPVQHSSRGVVSLDCRPEEVQDDLIVLESGDISARRSVLRRYRDRPTDTRNGNAALPGLGLLSCLQFWDWLTWKIRPRASSRVINYYPRYSNDPKYCRVKLMLHHPFTDWPDLLSVENESYGSYIDAFRACRRLQTHPPDFYDDPSDSNSGDEDPPEEAENEYPLADFEAFARRRPGADIPTHGDLLDGLGSREIDRAYDWSTHIGRYGDLRPDVWEQIKAENPIELSIDVNSSPEPLNLEQKELYDTIVTHYMNEISLTRLLRAVGSQR
ncbi:uncharacterized protein Z518_07583 [Rhinocladiella mackenziei CBS 650.93]|uniref:Helitron helicase-like domain-containing protein n=1 Tax=Rhinocladiella mackenziei CBS 650.93 TaxID=1442369 RepID=A0A0D2J4X2_9EURO|nr:uncharacterized protein Z518_07583 [Rhinocladiella mackenziei CBS 650.93]KIX04030.1 hypothetical protein Z518_07583 [Rhinocladiella mackenziei CBS 650.93]